MKKILLSLSLILSLNAEVIKTNYKTEPSGITIFKNEIYIVSDNGRVCNISKKFCKKYRKKYDFEGITNDKEFLYVAIEGKDKIVKLDKDLEIIEKYKVPRKFKGKTILKKGGDGIEALTYLYNIGREKIFAISNQSDKLYKEDSSEIILLGIKNRKVRIYSVLYMPYTDISGLFYKNGYLYAISDDNNKLLVLDESLDFKIIKEYNIKGEDQEGIFIDNNHIYIAQDSGNVLKLENFLKKE